MTMRGKQQSDKYRSFDPCVLTDREYQCVKLAKDGVSCAEIARRIGVSRQRVKQLLDKAAERQEADRYFER